MENHKADSNSKCNTRGWLSVAHRYSKKHLKRRSVPQDLTWPVVKTVYRFLHLLFSHIRQLHGFGKVLAQESIAVLIQAALPRMVGMREVDLRLQFGSDAFMPG